MKNRCKTIDEFILAVKMYVKYREKPKSQNFILESTPQILLDLGYKNLEVCLPTYVIDKSLIGKHKGEMTEDQFYDVLYSIIDPLFIFKSKQDKTSKIIHSEYFSKKDDQLLSVIINTNIKHKYSKIMQHIITSVHQRVIIANDKTNILKKQMKLGYCEYINDIKLDEIKKSQSYSESQILMLALLPIPLTYKNSITLKSEIINKKIQNNNNNALKSETLNKKGGNMFISLINAENEIRNQAEQNGVLLPYELNYSGNWISFDTEKKKKGSYWLKANVDDKFGYTIHGYIRDWTKHSSPIKVNSFGKVDITKEQDNTRNIKKENLVYKTEDEIKKEKEETQEEAIKIAKSEHSLSLNNSVNYYNEYLISHDIQDILEYVDDIGYRKRDDILVIPLYSNFTDELVSVQEIFQNGLKQNTKNAPFKDVHYTFLGDDERVFICEGWATGASIFLETKNTVICSLSAMNIESATEYAKENYINSKIIHIADNDLNEIGYSSCVCAKEKYNTEKVILIPRINEFVKDACDYRQFSSLFEFIETEISKKDEPSYER